ncbi:MAG: helix-turn-helix domain-containing protein [Ignavibacteriae bacterium]|nr:helix-turn-helix domain-containing protein [Ignavibacteriota bacterium]
MREANKNLLNLDEAASQLGIAKTTLRRWTDRGYLPSIRIGKRKDRRFKEKDIEDYLARHTQEISDETEQKVS